MNIAFDIDDILASFQLGWLEYNANKYGMSLTYNDITVYDYTVSMRLPETEVYKRLVEFWHSDKMDELQPTPNSQYAVSQLKLENKLSIITSRNQSIQDKTIAWIDRYFPHTFSAIYMTSQVTINGFNHTLTKASICQQQNIDLLVEDAPRYVEDTVKVGTHVALIEKPWNKSYTFQHNKLHRLKELTDIEKCLSTLK